MNKSDIKKFLIEKIQEIELENMESEDTERQEVRGKIVDRILAEVDKVMVAK